MSRTTEPSPAQPFVSLVGAGPGTPDLLTLRGLQALQQADVILYDALLEPDFAALFREAALAIPVGKRCGGGTPQARIHELLLTHAKPGVHVVRLKGGDPLLYGRGGEEAQLLEAFGIPFEFIPGVSALQGVAAASGIPLTHRGVSRELRVLEGHHLLEDAVDWTELAAFRGTLALFMATRPLPDIARRLLDHGARPDHPVALVERAFCEGQVTTVSTLALAAEGHLCCRTEGPGLVLLGAVIHERTRPLLPHVSLTHIHDPAAAVSGSEGPPRAAGGRGERRAG
ncbi:MAG TPA: uroporphyrinogen-III C-methyltransferase [Holophagaceae bacterium]|nr:uroporphyrinogen-III C-methyltransferase [Holophagaceae bacterium]